ncbi:KxYKxGKxW signal peptide domain-containing protein, partial [Apilactobacillus kunkeei]
MNKEVKSKKILHKVKKNWVVIGMSSVALLGTGFVVSQTSSALPTGVVAHADETTSTSDKQSSSSTTNSTSDKSNDSSAVQQSSESAQPSNASQSTSIEASKSGDYSAPQSSVNATISNLGSQTTNVKKDASINYSLTLTNNDSLGRVIPKGTQIKINVNTPEKTSFNDVFSYSVYSNYSSQNNFDDSISGNTITLTTNKDFYPGTVNINLSLVVKGPKYDWDGDSEEHETNPDPVNVNITSSLQLPGESEQNINVDGNQISVLPNTKEEDQKKNPDDIGIPGYLSSHFIKNYPDDVKDYSQSNTNGNYVNTDGGSAYYSPSYTNKDGKPYFVVTGEFNRGNIAGYYGTRILFSDGKNFDLNNLKLYASHDEGVTFEDITDKPGVSFGIDNNGAVYSDFSKSAYTKDIVDFVAYRPYTDLSGSYHVVGYGDYYRSDIDQNGSQRIGEYTYKIIPAKGDTGSSWIVAPNQTAYTQPDGTYVYSANSLKDGVNVYKTVNGNPGGYEKLDNATVDVTNDGNVSDGQTIKVAPGASQQLNLTYTSTDSSNAKAQATFTLVNPYVSISDQKVTRTATVNYVDSTTNKVIKTDSSSVEFVSSGLKDTRDNSITWDPWKISSGETSYKFTVPTIDGYVPEDTSEMTGTLTPLGDDVVKTVYMDPLETVTQTRVKDVNVLAKDKTNTSGPSGSYVNIPGYDQHIYVTFTKTGIKNQKTGEVTWGSYEPDKKAVTANAAQIPNYTLVSNPTVTKDVSAPLGDTEPTYTEISFLYVPKPASSESSQSSSAASSAQSSSAESSSAASSAQSSSAESSSAASSAQSSEAESSAVSSSAESSAVSSSAESSAVSSSAESSAESSKAESSAVSSEAESSAVSSKAESSAVSSSAESSAESSKAESSAVSSKAESSAVSSKAESSAVSSK